MTPDEVREIAEKLHDYATHFAPRDWAYTRDLGDLKSVRYGATNPYDHWRARWRRALGCFVGRAPSLGGHRISRWGMARTYLRSHIVMPDGVLDGGSIIAHWEETGEYLQFVQPTVGALIAAWLLYDADNPHAQRVATEMKRIQDDYAARLGIQGQEEPT